MDFRIFGTNEKNRVEIGKIKCQITQDGIVLADLGKLGCNLVGDKMVFAFAASGAVLGRRHCGLGLSSCSARSRFRVRMRRVHQRNVTWTMKVGIFYSTSTGNTEEIAGIIKEKLGDECPDDPKDIAESTASDLTSYDTVVIGAPTWNTGADDERTGTDMDNFLYELDDVSLEGRAVACFGLGDSDSYREYFCDALEEVHDRMATTGAKMIGYVDTDYLDFDESKAVRNGKFLGLAVDNVNGDVSEVEEYIGKWCEQILAESKVAA